MKSPSAVWSEMLKRERLEKEAGVTWRTPAAPRAAREVFDRRVPVQRLASVADAAAAAAFL
jgi:hypothetical protein